MAIMRPFTAANHWNGIDVCHGGVVSLGPTTCGLYAFGAQLHYVYVPCTQFEWLEIVGEAIHFL